MTKDGELKKAVASAEKLHKQWQQGTKPWQRRVDKLFDTVLKQFKVDRAAYHSRSFTGGASKRLMSQFAEITVALKEAVKEYDDGLNAEDKLEAWPVDLQTIYTKLDAFADCFEAFEAVNIIMKSTKNASNADLEDFPKLVKTFTEMYLDLHTNEQGKSLGWTPKIHVLFQHAYLQLLRFGTLGRCSEEKIEQAHQLVSRYMKVFESVRSMPQKMDAVNSRMSMVQDPKVVEASMEVQRKRSQTGEGERKRESKKTAKVAAKEGERQAKREDIFEKGEVRKVENKLNKHKIIWANRI
jgi:hypothetical protein